MPGFKWYSFAFNASLYHLEPGTVNAVNDSYIGIGLRYENKVFIEIGPREYMKSKEIKFKIGLGINIGF